MASSGKKQGGGSARGKNDKRAGTQDARGRGKEEAVPGGRAGADAKKEGAGRKSAPKKEAAGDQYAYVLLHSLHKDFTTGKSYEKGDLVLSDVPLLKSFPGKFRKATQEEMRAGHAVEAEEGEERDEPISEAEAVQLSEVRAREESRGEEGGDGEEESAGQDVTEDFPDAEKNGLQVTKQSDDEFLVTGDDCEEQLGSEAEVKKFLAGYGK